VEDWMADSSVSEAHLLDLRLDPLLGPVQSHSLAQTRSQMLRVTIPEQR
jgi:hypothetical protein